MSAPDLRCSMRSLIIDRKLRDDLGAEMQGTIDVALTYHLVLLKMGCRCHAGAAWHLMLSTLARCIMIIYGCAIRSVSAGPSGCCQEFDLGLTAQVDRGVICRI